MEHPSRNFEMKEQFRGNFHGIIMANEQERSLSLKVPEPPTRDSFCRVPLSLARPSPVPPLSPSLIRKSLYTWSRLVKGRSKL
jgi:hypothetical protein